MNKEIITILKITIIIFIAFTNLSAISLSSLNDFEDGTTMGWEVGSGVNPVNIADGGPMGAGDNFLRSTSDGAGQNGKIVIFNGRSTWTGNWVSAGVTYISFKARNSGSTDLTIRISLDGPGGMISSKEGILLPARSGWVDINIPVKEENFSLVNGSSISNTLMNAVTMRILHSLSPSWKGASINGVLDLDLIAARNSPVSNIDRITVQEFNVYPNPVTDHLNIELGHSTQNAEINIYNELGRVIWNQQANNSTETIQMGYQVISGWKSGLYFIEVVTEIDRLVEKLIVIK